MVYIQSFTLLRLCHVSLAPDAKAARAPLAATIFNTLDEDSVTEKSMSELGMLVNATIVGGQEVSKEIFQQRCASFNIIHIHGHSSVFEKEGPQHKFLLRASGTADADRIIVGEILDLALFKFSLVLAMSCNIGRVKIFETGDLQGLTAATHFAGVGAFISTLWMIDKHDCILFAKGLLRRVHEKFAGCRVRRNRV